MHPSPGVSCIHLSTIFDILGLGWALLSLEWVLSVLGVLPGLGQALNDLKGTPVQGWFLRTVIIPLRLKKASQARSRPCHSVVGQLPT